MLMGLMRTSMNRSRRKKMLLLVNTSPLSTGMGR
jgi:hypothetical protein